MSSWTAGWSEAIPPAAFDAAVALLERAARDGATVVLAAHVAPDGDALGATLALHAGLSWLGASTVPTVGEEPLRIPQELADLPGAKALCPPSQLPPASEVAVLVTLDAAAPDRLGTLAELAASDVPTLVIDHHERNTPFGDVRLVAPRAAASVVVVDEVLRRLGVELTRDIATCLYVGLVTDTGRFGHASTDRATMELAGRLLDAGIDHAELTRRLFVDRPLGYLRLLGRALARLTFVPDLALLHTHLTPADVAASGAALEHADAVVDVVRAADVAEIALVLRPGSDGRWRVALRSKGQVDVGAVAERLGGGGHARAAGFTADGPADTVIDTVLAVLREG